MPVHADVFRAKLVQQAKGEPYHGARAVGCCVADRVRYADARGTGPYRRRVEHP